MSTYDRRGSGMRNAPSVKSVKGWRRAKSSFRALSRFGKPFNSKQIKVDLEDPWQMKPDVCRSTPAELEREEPDVLPLSTHHVVTLGDVTTIVGPIRVDHGTDSCSSSTDELHKSHVGGDGSARSISQVASYSIDNHMTGMDESFKVNQDGPGVSSEVPNDTIEVVGQEIVEASDQPRRNHSLRKEAKLHKLRWRNLLTRSAAFSQRVELGEARLALTVADKSFMKLARDRQYANSNSEAGDLLEEAIQKLEASRTKYNDLEEAYNIIEDRLDREESELTKLEEQFSKQNPPSNSPDDASQTSGSSASSDFSSIPEVARHPSYKAYLSRLGDADNIRESYADLIQENDNLRESFNMRQPVGMKLHSKDLAYLNEFPSQKAHLLKEFQEVAADIKRLRQVCIEEGLLDANNFKEPSEIDIELHFEVISTTSKSLPRTQSRFALLLAEQDAALTLPPLPPPSSLLPEAPASSTRLQPAPDVIRKQQTRNMAITHWLLQKLRSSPREIALLHRFSNSISPVVDEDEWQQRVLHCWYVDGAGMGTTARPPVLNPPTPLPAPDPPGPPPGREQDERNEGQESKPAFLQPPPDKGKQPAEPPPPPPDPTSLPVPFFTEDIFLENIVDSTTVGLKLDYGLFLQRMRPRERRAMSL